MVKEAGIAPLRFHVLRHTAITDLATDQNSDETIMSLAGHVSGRMMTHYSHIWRDARREAVKGLSKRNPRLTRQPRGQALATACEPGQ
jgi:integrase